MRQAQKEILTAVAHRLSMQPVATTISKDGLAYFTTSDKQTSIALQVGMHDSIPQPKHAPCVYSLGYTGAMYEARSPW